MTKMRVCEPEVVMTQEERFYELVCSFHGLHDAPGVYHEKKRVDHRRLDAWAAGNIFIGANNLSHPPPGDGSKHAARFVLCVWSSAHHWECCGLGEVFQLFQALAAWDAKHTKAFQAWAADPWRG